MERWGPSLLTREGKKWEGVPSTLGRGGKGRRDRRLWGRGGVGMWRCGGQMLPPSFGTPDAVDKQEDEHYEQEPHNGSQALQPWLQATLGGCWKVRGGGTQRWGV